jgi:hypothetical protein
MRLVDKMRKLCIIIPIWGRDWLTNHLLNYYYQFDDSRTEYMIVVVGSEGKKSERLARGLTYINRGNEPLDRKYDEGFLYCKQFNPDAVTLIGSDDFITQNYFEWALDHVKRGTHYVGLKDFHLVDTGSNQIHYWEGYSNTVPSRKNDSIGAGRIYSEFLLNKINWQPFIVEGKGHFHWHGDDERAENKIIDALKSSYQAWQPLKIITKMKNADNCRYWAVKTGEEINPSSNFFLNRQSLYNATTREIFSQFFSDTGFPSSLMGDTGAVYPDGSKIWVGVNWAR